FPSTRTSSSAGTRADTPCTTSTATSCCTATPPATRPGVRRWACRSPALPRIVRSGPRRVTDSQHSTVTIRRAFVAIRAGKTMRNSRRRFLKLLVTTGAAGGLSGPGRAFTDTERAPAVRGEVLELTATEALSAMAAGDLRAETYAAILLGRARSLRNLNVLISQVPEQVLEAARAADKARAHGHLLGPLHGLPLLIKDNINSAALPTTAGTPSLIGNRPRANAHVLDALLRPGVREVVPIAHTRDTPGPVARSVADVALLDAVITGQPRTLPRADRHGLRLGVARRSFFADLDPALEEVVDEALDQLQDSGVV